MKYLIVGPGGMMFYSYLGCIVKLLENGSLSDLKEISGSSAGALCSFAYLLGMSDTRKLVTECINQDLSKLGINIKNFIKHYGFVSEDVSRNYIGDFCFKFLGKNDITFKELYEKTKIKLHVSAFSLDKYQVEYFSVDIAPNMSVVDAVSMSLSVPFIFAPYKNHLDGGISEDIPYGPFIDKDINDVFVINSHNNERIKEAKTLYSYILNFLEIYRSIRHKCPIAYQGVCIPIDVNIFNFKLTNETRCKLYTQGYALLM